MSKLKPNTIKIIKHMIERDKLLLKTFDLSPRLARDLLNIRIETMEESLNEKKD